MPMKQQKHVEACYLLQCCRKCMFVRQLSQILCELDVLKALHFDISGSMDSGCFEVPQVEYVDHHIEIPVAKHVPLDPLACAAALNHFEPTAEKNGIFHSVIALHRFVPCVLKTRECILNAGARAAHSDSPEDRGSPTDPIRRPDCGRARSEACSCASGSKGSEDR